jgi:predicted nucleotidyltransferase
MTIEKMPLPEIKRALIAHLEGRPEIVFAVLFGSAVGDGPFHDLDVAIWVDRNLVPASEDLNYAFSLAGELEHVLPYPVDVRVINDAPLPFRYNVSRGVRLVANNDELFYSFLERTWDEYFDFEPVLLQYLKDLK